MADPASTQATPRARRRLLVAALLRASLTATVLVVLYYNLPLDEGLGLSPVVRWVLGLTVFALVLGWQISKVVRSSHPIVRAIEALAVTIPLFLVVFAATYYLMSIHGTGTFSQGHLTRTDTLYFAVTIFSTVGFGDIVATSQGARIVVTAQMILDLVILGLVVKAFGNAARAGRERQSSSEEAPQTSP